MFRSPLVYLHHILDETKYLIEVSTNLQKDQFLRDETLKKAVVRSLEVIGEATKNVPTEFRQKYSQVEWKSMAGMRDILIHRYFWVNYHVVWDVLMTEIPQLQEEIERIIQQEHDTLS